MANNYASTTYTPEIPKALVTPRLEELCDAMYITLEKHGECFYLYSEDGQFSGDIEQKDGSYIEVTEDDLYAELQEIIKNSQGVLQWVSSETAYTCDKMRPGGFGGSAVFITADDIQYCSTSSWLQERISEVETGDTHD